jgi:hypothetical protein
MSRTLRAVLPAAVLLALGAAGCGAHPAAPAPAPQPSATVTKPTAVQISASASAAAAAAASASSYAAALARSDSASAAAASAAAAVSAAAAARAAALADTIEFVVTGSFADVTYGPAGSDLTGSVPMDVRQKIPSAVPVYYAISAQLQGGGSGFLHDQGRRPGDQPGDCPGRLQYRPVRDRRGPDRRLAGR